ncbi:MAG: hydrogen peroxide-inducible genes activator [Salibacteraceae bacterium]
MTIQQLNYVVALDTHRHFVKAAESCFVAQPTLTLQVKKLEQELGLTLFDRSVQPLVPTPMGELFVLKARQILRDVNSLMELVKSEKNDLEGTFRLGVIPTLAPYLLPRFLKDFSDQHPKIRLEIRELTTENILRGLKADTLDLGLLVTPVDENQLREIPLFYEPFWVFASAENPLLSQETVAPDSLTTDGLWLLQQGHCFRNQVLNLCQQNQLSPSESRFSFESGSIETLKNMVKSNLGYTLIPELSLQQGDDQQYVRKFSDPQPAREVSLVVHSGFTKELLIDHLRDTILKHTPDHFRKNERFVRIKWR